MLSVALTNKPLNVRITFVDARDEEGNNLDNWSGSFGQHFFWKSLKLSKPTTVRATVAIRENYKAEITFGLVLKERRAARNDDERRIASAVARLTRLTHSVRSPAT